MTGFHVQYEVDDDPEIFTETELKAVPCSVCTRLHLINRKTGKVLGQDKSEDAQPLSSLLYISLET